MWDFVTFTASEQTSERTDSNKTQLSPMHAHCHRRVAKIAPKQSMLEMLLKNNA